MSHNDLMHRYRSAPRSPSDVSEFSAGQALSRLIALGAVASGIVAGHVAFGVGVPCPLRDITGIQCPFCGATRAAAALMSGQIGDSWSFNPVVVLLAPVLILCGVIWAIECYGGPVVRLPSCFPALTQRRVYIAGAILGGIFMVVRNLV